MRKYLWVLVLVTFFDVFLASRILYADLPTKKSLLIAWTDNMRNDSNTLQFEKLDEKLYKYKTNVFPFDGQLKVLNIHIDDRWNDYRNGMILGVVEVELIDLPADFLQKHSYSYSAWSQNNTLYYDKKSNKWLSSKTYFARNRKKLNYGTWNFLAGLFSYGPMIFLIIIVVIFIIYTNRIYRKNQIYMTNAHDMAKKTMDLAQKSIALNEETNKILIEIVALLKSK